MSFTNSFFPRRIALVLRTLKPGCDVITAYDASWNFMGKLSPVLMSVPEKPHGKFGVVKKELKSWKKPCLSVRD